MHFSVLGMMSGTSLDGVDLAFCNFIFENNQWKFEIVKAETIPYTAEWKKRLQTATQISGLELSLLNVEYGRLIGNWCKDFLQKNNLKPDFISSHGHTIFHQPERNFTLQIGDGAAIAAVSGIKTINQFRNTDVALGGQGAPLVPIGDKMLFADYDFCLNLGGIANISYFENDTRKAFDISPCNMALNHIISRQGKAFDSEGQTAHSGQIIPEVLEQMNALDFYAKTPPKTLGIEWFEQYFKVLLSEKFPVEDLLRTSVEHIAIQIANCINPYHKNTVLTTGGGTLNRFLIERIQANCNAKIIVPNKQIIDYKEALIFAFLGVLRILEQPNCLQSVTGACKDNIGGAIYI